MASAVPNASGLAVRRHDLAHLLPLVGAALVLGEKVHGASTRVGAVRSHGRQVAADRHRIAEVRVGGAVAGAQRAQLGQRHRPAGQGLGQGGRPQQQAEQHDATDPGDTERADE